MAVPIQTALTIVGLAKETTLFTAVNPSTSDQFLMVKNMKPSDEAEKIVDEGYRGLMTKTFGDFQGFRMGKWTFDAFAYPIPLGTLFMGMFGADGWASGTTHPFTVAAGLPPSYTISDFYGVSGSSTRRYAGHYFESLSLSYASSGELKVTATTIGQASPAQTLAAKPTAVYDASAPFIPYEATSTFNGGANTKLIAANLKFNRAIEPVFGANGTQDPTAVSAGPFEFTGTVNFALGDDTELNYYENATVMTPNSIVFTAGGNSLTITATQMRFDKGTVIDRGSPYAKVAASFTGIYNATDGGPAKVTLIGGKSGAAY